MLPRPGLARPNLPRPNPLRCWRRAPRERWPARSASAFDLLLQRLEARAIKPAHRLHRGLVAQLRRRIVVGKAAIERAGPLPAPTLASVVFMSLPHCLVGPRRRAAALS